MKKYAAFLVLVVLMVAFSGCSVPRVRCTAPDDTPPHHYLQGMEALEKGRVDDADERFGRAVFCNEKYSPGYSGAAIVLATKARGTYGGKERASEAGQLDEMLRKAGKSAEEPADVFHYQLARLRAAILLKGKGWLAESEDAYRKAAQVKVGDQQLLYYEGKEAAGYFMGVAYLEGLEIGKSHDRFGEVLKANVRGKWHEKADRAWRKSDKIIHAMAGITVGDVGRSVAVKDSISRADLAALLIDEMNLEKLIERRSPPVSTKAFFPPADIAASPFRDEIEAVMKLHVRGLEPEYDQATRSYLFKPGEGVSRGEMALILEDILIRLTGEEKLSTAHRKQDKSPFSDVNPSSPFYNAALNMTVRGIMESGQSGDFRVNDLVDGAEALHALRVMSKAWQPDSFHRRE